MSDEEAWVGFRVSRTPDDGGARFVDQFFVTPEPHSALLATFVVAVTFARRRFS